jgi:photosystem II stability/assembly factor-like uncharacterized protein
LVLDPTDPNVIFAGGIGGGVWKSVDGGTTWKPLSDTLGNIAVSSLVMDPTNPQTIYAGTGDVREERLRPGARGAGIMKSTDGGANWSYLPSTQTKDFEFVTALKISANDPNRLYAGTGSGFWLSTDGGQNWNQTYKSADAFGCTDLAVRTDKQPDVILMSCGGLQKSEGVKRSTDGGQTWEQVVAVINGQPAARSGLAIAPSNQDVMYASAGQLKTGLPLGLLKSTEGGAPNSWTVVNEGAGKPGSPDWLGYCDNEAGFGNGDYANSLAVDPTDPEKLVVGGVDTYRSDDGGKTLKRMTYWWLDTPDQRLASTDGKPYVHADIHGIYFDPHYDGQSNKRVFFATDGGVFRTDDVSAPIPDDFCDETEAYRPGQATSKVAFTGLNVGYVTSLFNEGVVSAGGKVFVGGLQDNGTWADNEVTRPTNGWVGIAGGDGGGVAIDPGATTIYSTTNGGPIYKSSGLDPATYNPFTNGIDEEGPFVTNIEMDPNDPNVLWTGRSSMWRTTNGAQGWQKVGQPLGGGLVSTIAVAKGNGNLVYAGTDVGSLWRTNEGLGNGKWEQVGQGAISEGEISAIAIDPTNNNTVYVTVDIVNGGHVFKTTDGGATWANVDGTGTTGIPNTPAISVAINPLNTAMVYVGTDNGVFESLDAGATWRVANENLATTTVQDLVFPPDTSDLFAFTYGRGVYRVDVGTQTPPGNDNIAAATPVNLQPNFADKVSVRLATSEAGDPPLSCGAEGNPQQGKSVWYSFSPTDGGKYTITTEESNYDTVVGVFTGGGGNLTPVACDDDTGGAGSTSRVELDAQPGTNYLIEVAKSSDAGEGLGGTLILNVSK